MTAEFDSFYLLNGYVPNSGDGLKRLVLDLKHNITSLGPCLVIHICHWTPLVVSFCGSMTVLSILVIQGYTMGSSSQQLHESKIAFICPFIILFFF